MMLLGPQGAPRLSPALDLGDWPFLTLGGLFAGFRMRAEDVKATRGLLFVLEALLGRHIIGPALLHIHLLAVEVAAVLPRPASASARCSFPCRPVRSGPPFEAPPANFRQLPWSR